MSRSFSLSIEKFADKIRGRETVFVQKLCLDIDKGLVMSTPVDTGTARGGWSVGINEIVNEALSSDLSLGAILSSHNSKIREVKAGDRIFLSNNVNYIQYLDKGSSQQAPNGMVDKTLQRFPQIIQEAGSEAKRGHP